MPEAPVSDGDRKPSPRSRPVTALAGPRAEKPVALALQGGGAHGAFTWGVLDALIEDGRLAFEAVTGASAGRDERRRDGRRLARRAARTAPARGWSGSGARSASTATLGPAQRHFVSGLFSLWKGNPVAEFWSKMLAPSPYVSNPLNINPLRKALAEQVDFERLRAAETAGLFVSATNVWTGKLAVFERERLTVDHLMASACLPTVFQAVEIDGVPYWDGGYLGNPPLYPLHRGAQTRDILLVQINPVERRETPRTESEIRDRLNEITFNANLMRELRAIDFLDGLIEEGDARPGPIPAGSWSTASTAPTRWRITTPPPSSTPAGPCSSACATRAAAPRRPGSPRTTRGSAATAPSTCSRRINKDADLGISSRVGVIKNPTIAARLAKIILSENVIS